MTAVRYRVTHQTRYAYTGEVGLGYNRAVLRPRDTGRQKVTAFALDIDPAPDHRHDHVDLYGNTITVFSIEQSHKTLTVTANSEVELPADDPQLTLAGLAPWEEAVTAAAALTGPERAFALDSPLVGASEELAAYARPSFPPGRSTYDAVGDLTARIFEEFEYRPGSTSVTTPTHEVLASRAGVCQDFAHLQIGCLRSLGLAARYVSGYLETQPPPGQPKLVGADASHAWLSVLLGDGTWLDLDPTNGLVDPTSHVTVAYGRDYADVAPLSGVIFAGAVTSTLSVAVDVLRLS